MAEGQRRGTVDASLEHRHLLVLLIGMTNYYFMAQHTTRMILDEDPYSPAALARQRTLVVEAARRIVAPAG